MSGMSSEDASIPERQGGDPQKRDVERSRTGVSKESAPIRLMVWAASGLLPRSARDRLRRSIGESVGLFRTLSPLATGSGEVFQLLAFIARFALTRRFPGRFSREVGLRLGGATHVIGPDTTEIYSLEEIYVREQYDRHPDFIPQSGWNVFDVGANVGVFAVRQALRGAVVWAFEPNVSCYRRLVRSIEANGLSHSVSPFNAALGAASGKGIVVVPGAGHWTTSGQVSTVQTNTAGSEIQVSSLDDVTEAEQVTEIDLLKVDVEGAELEVLRGARKSLRAVKKAIVEYHSSQLRAEAMKVLGGHGFAPALEVPLGASPDVGVLYFTRTSPGEALPRTE